MALVALLTDFGDSEYAGVMRGVLHRTCPGVTVVDLFHDVQPQAVREGAWILLQGFRYFPEGTVFCCVVDPGVGTDRAAVAVRTRRYQFVGPDNGLLYPAVEADGGALEVVRLPVPPGASNTFHGRDLFAPAAARLAAGEPLATLGTPAPGLKPLHFHRQGREGEVVRVDRFGNIITNLPPVPGKTRYRLRLGGFAAELPFYPAYGYAQPGELLVTDGSSGTLEVAVREGSALERLAPLVGAEGGSAGSLLGMRIVLE
ncbi:MAG: SAM-dependent chlorinase/fluorinase [Firmicutes bacterium]|nr:SAM-dependent chlorinase/fluorinase [Bacillota bacterium]